MKLQEHQLLVRSVPGYAGVEDFDVPLATERFARVAHKSGEGIGDRISEKDGSKEPGRFRGGDLVVADRKAVDPLTIRIQSKAQDIVADHPIVRAEVRVRRTAELVREIDPRLRESIDVDSIGDFERDEEEKKHDDVHRDNENQPAGSSGHGFSERWRTSLLA